MIFRFGMSEFLTIIKRWRLHYLGLWRSHGFRRKTFEFNKLRKAAFADHPRYLYASAVNREGKERLAQIIREFGHKDFDYLIFVYDDTLFDDEIFRKCKFVYEKGIKCFFWKKYLTPEYCRKYSYLFLWDDDIDITGFSYQNFINIMIRNNLEMAQPALTARSNISLKITQRNTKVKVGRYVDFVEVMVPVFESSCWPKFWDMLDVDINMWGNALDLVAKDFCNFTNMGIVDQEAVTHVRRVNNDPGKVSEVSSFLKKHKTTKKSVFVSYAHLR